MESGEMGVQEVTKSDEVLETKVGVVKEDVDVAGVGMVDGQVKLDKRGKETIEEVERKLAEIKSQKGSIKSEVVSEKNFETRSIQMGVVGKLVVSEGKRNIMERSREVDKSKEETKGDNVVNGGKRDMMERKIEVGKTEDVTEVEDLVEKVGEEAEQGSEKDEERMKENEGDDLEETTSEENLKQEGMGVEESEIKIEEKDVAEELGESAVKVEGKRKEEEEEIVEEVLGIEVVGGKFVRERKGVIELGVEAAEGSFEGSVEESYEDFLRGSEELDKGTVYNSLNDCLSERGSLNSEADLASAKSKTEILEVKEKSRARSNTPAYTFNEEDSKMHINRNLDSSIPYPRDKELEDIISMASRKGSNNEPSESSTQESILGYPGMFVKWVSSFRSSSSEDSLPDYKIYRVLEDLENLLSEMYRVNQDWKYEILVTFKNISAVQVCDLFNLKTNLNGATEVRVISDSELFTTPPKRENVLILGEPGFGKTTLTSMLTTFWASSRPPVAYFKFCIHIPLSTVNLRTNFQDYVLEFIAKMLQDRHYSHTVEEIKKSFEKNAENILLIFDDYDQMSIENKGLFSNFLKQKTVFKNSTILVTSRDLTEDSFLKQFDKIFTLRGFSTDHVLQVLKRSSANFSESSLQTCSQLNYLTGMPPNVLGCIWKMVSSNLLEIGAQTSLKMLLDGVTDILAVTFFSKSDSTADSNASRQVHLKLGKMFYLALVRGQCRFDVELMNSVFQTELSFIQKCYFMFKESCTSSIWTVSNKTWMVYFATKYLNNTWSELNCDKQRLGFLQNQFCVGGCTGDWVFVESLRCLYYVGPVPEIVLQLQPPYNLKSATFEMYHDVPFAQILRSDAFDSVTLLSRIDERNLQRFGFQNCEKKHVEVTEVLHNKLQNHLVVADYEGNINFQYNVIEKKVFVKMWIGSMAYPEASLHAIYRANEKYVDRVYIHFSFGVLPDVFELLCRLMKPCVRELELARVAMYQQYDEFVFTLLWSLLHAKTCMPVYVTCCGDVDANNDVTLQQVNFKIFTSSSSKTKYVEVSKFSLGSSFKFYKKLTYDSETLWANKPSIRTFAQEIRSSTSNPTICINVSNDKNTDKSAK